MMYLRIILMSASAILSSAAYSLSPAKSTRLHQTVSQGLVEIIKTGGCSYESYPGFLHNLFLHRHNGRFHELNDIFEIDSVLDREDTTALGLSFRHSNPDMAKNLLRIGADIYAPGTNGKSAFDEVVAAGGLDEGLFIAVELGNIEMAAHLLDAGADANSRSSYGDDRMYSMTRNAPLLVAAKTGNAAMFELLLESRADIHVVDSRGYGALHRAAESGSQEIIAMALSKGADLNGKTAKGDVLHQSYTPLHVAADAKQEGVVRSLLAAGADPNVQDERGNTPAHVAARWSGGQAVLQALTEGGADFNIENNKGELPLSMFVASSRSLDSVKALFDGGIDVNAADSNGNTVLHMAVYLGRTEELINILLENGADVNSRNTEGKTPLDMVLTEGASQSMQGGKNFFHPQGGQGVSDSRARAVEILREAGGKTSDELDSE